VVFSTTAQPLEVRPLVLVQHQPVGGLPDRHLLEVPGADLARAVARKAQLHAPPLVVQAGRQELQALAELPVQALVQQLHLP
jgi:hypothetical protein